MMTPYRLWSLWDMLNFKAHEFIDIANRLIAWKASWDCYEDFRARSGVKVRDLEDTKACLSAVLDSCRDMGFATTALSASRLQDALNQIDVSKAVPLGVGMDPSLALIPLDQMMLNFIRRRIEEFRTRLYDDVSLTTFLQLDARDLKLFEPAEPLFGKEVADRFPSLAYEIEQGGKCQALNLSTAAAFHFIRCLEGGITALSRCLSIPDPTKGSDRNWNNLLKKLEDAIKVKWPTSGSRFTGDGQFFEWAHGTLKAMQNPYRNSTMHLDQKYTPDEAKLIMELAKGFMQKIASRLDEDGLPFA